MRTNSKPVATKVTVTTTTTTQRHTTATPKPATTSKQVVTTTTTSRQTNSSKPVTTSKPASKPSSQAPSKKVEVQKVVVSSNGDEIKDTFELFDANGDGRINAREIRGAMQNIGYDEKNPMVYEVMTELDNPRNKNQGGATFNDFCQTVNYRVPERETTEDLRRVFNLFLDDPNSETTSLESIKRVADELGENIEELELNAMLNKATKAGAKLTFDDFVAIMTGNTNL
jgi:Ca2+-binding EF-hand superfamily protein